MAYDPAGLAVISHGEGTRQHERYARGLEPFANDFQNFQFFRHAREFIHAVDSYWIGARNRANQIPLHADWFKLGIRRVKRQCMTREWARFADTEIHNVLCTP